MAGEVKTAQTTIEEHWPEHGGHKSGTRHARWSTAEGIVCACGDVLGWPDPEHRETLAQYTKRKAAEQVDAASAPGRVQGAFGAYSRPTPEPEDGASATVLPGGDNAPEPGDYPEPEVQEPEGLPAGDGRVAYDDLPYDVPEGPTDGDPWGDDTPDDEPEPEPWPAAPVAEEAVVVAGPVDFGKLADEAQTESDPPWSAYEDYGGEPKPSNEGIPAEQSGGEIAVREEPGVGQEVVPFAGTPIFPTEGQTLDPLVDRLDPLDPTLPYTPEDVELKIVDIMRAIDRSELFLRQQIAREHAAQHNLDFRYNLAIAQSDAKAADQRKAEAWIATERQRFEATEASMLVRALRDAQHNLRSVLSGYQSVARSLGVSLTNALDGRHAGPPRPPLPQEPPPDPWTN
jgi:hypothetical protein